MLELEHNIHIIYLLDRGGYESAICIKRIDRDLKHQSCEQEIKDDERSLSLVRKACHPLLESGFLHLRKLLHLIVVHIQRVKYRYPNSYMGSS